MITGATSGRNAATGASRMAATSRGSGTNAGRRAATATIGVTRKLLGGIQRASRRPMTSTPAGVRVEPDLLLRLAERGRDRVGVAGIGLAAGQRDLAGVVVAAVLDALGEDEVRLAVRAGVDEDEGGRQLGRPPAAPAARTGRRRAAAPGAATPAAAGAGAAPREARTRTSSGVIPRHGTRAAVPSRRSGRCPRGRRRLPSVEPLPSSPVLLLRRRRRRQVQDRRSGAAPAAGPPRPPPDRASRRSPASATTVAPSWVKTSVPPTGSASTRISARA